MQRHITFGEIMLRLKPPGMEVLFQRLIVFIFAMNSRKFSGLGPKEV